MQCYGGHGYIRDNGMYRSGDAAIGPGCLPRIDVPARQSAGATGIPVLAIGRLGAGITTDFASQDDLARDLIFGAARHSIRIAQQDVGISQLGRADAIYPDSALEHWADFMRDIIVCHGESGGGPHGYRDGAVLLGRDAQRIAGTLRGDKANIELWYHSIHPDDRAAYLEAERRRKERDESYTLEYRIMHPTTRELRWVQETGWTVQLLERDSRYFDSYVIDITERKRAEALLAGQNRILEMIARGRPLAETLDGLTRFIEAQCAGMMSTPPKSRRSIAEGRRGSTDAGRLVGDRASTRH